MKTLKTKNWASCVACLVAAIFLIATNAVAAQEIQVAGITISIPKRAKTPTKNSDAGFDPDRRKKILRR